MSWNGDYSTGATDPDTWSRIFVRAFVLAAMVHLFLFAGFYFATLNEFGAPYYDRIYPRVFAVEALEIDPKLLDQADALAEDEGAGLEPAAGAAADRETRFVATITKKKDSSNNNNKRY